MKLVKIFFISKILLIFCFFNSSFGSIKNDIIAKVGEEIITSFDLENKIKITLILAKQEINQENINKYCFTKDENTFLDKSYPELSAFENIPMEIKDEMNYTFNIDLPKKETIYINNDLPTFIYTAYNLDSNWKKDEKANRILLLEPSHYKKYPVSKKVMDFYILLSKEIEDLQIAVMEFSEFETYVDNHSKIYYKEHPFSRHFIGNKEERDWIFPEIDAKGSFFSYWKKGIKTYQNK